tara:strand:- start:206 stop:1525 length:1320 start_codon:yes stop_codon:yes gene_type:complete
MSSQEIANLFGKTTSEVYWDQTSGQASLAPGGWCLYLSGGVYVGGVYNSGFPYLPVETDSPTQADYYMECYIQNVGTDQRHYMGSNEFNEGFSSLGGHPGSYGYWVMSNTNPGNSWTKVSGYIGGFSASTVGTFENGTKYWSPLALFNYGAGSGTRACRISGWKVYKVYQKGNRKFAGNLSANVGTFNSPDASASILMNLVANNGNNAATFRTTASGSIFEIRSQNSGTIKIDSSSTTFTGNVGIGTTAPSTKLHVSSNGTSTRFQSNTSYSDILFTSTAGSNFLNFDSGNSFVIYQGGGSSNNVTMKVTLSGTATFKGDVVAYGSPSDIRLKENIKPIESALDKVSKLNGVTFDWKEKTECLDKEGNPINLQQWKHDIGFIAQDVQKVIPELVRENQDGMLSMRHQGIAPILLEAIKEQQKQIDGLQKQIETLKQKNK